LVAVKILSGVTFEQDNYVQAAGKFITMDLSAGVSKRFKIKKQGYHSQ
jgi:hypothetical protein